MGIEGKYVLGSGWDEVLEPWRYALYDLDDNVVVAHSSSQYLPTIVFKNLTINNPLLVVTGPGGFFFRERFSVSVVGGDLSVDFENMRSHQQHKTMAVALRAAWLP